MATPDTRSSVVILKQFTYRGATRTFSNRYHFEGSVPASADDWATFCDNIVAAEAAIFAPGVEIIQATGYDSASASSSNPHGDAVFSKPYTTVGTWSPPTGTTEAPGDCCALVRYATLARSSKNHPVYLFNYWHGVYLEDSALDEMSTSQRTAMLAYAEDWITGFSDGSITHERCGPRGAAATTRTVSVWVHHRDFPG